MSDDTITNSDLDDWFDRIYNGSIGSLRVVCYSEDDDEYAILANDDGSDDLDFVAEGVVPDLAHEIALAVNIAPRLIQEVRRLRAELANVGRARATGAGGANWSGPPYEYG